MRTFQLHRQAVATEGTDVGGGGNSRHVLLPRSSHSISLGSRNASSVQYRGVPVLNGRSCLGLSRAVCCLKRSYTYLGLHVHTAATVRIAGCFLDCLPVLSYGGMQWQDYMNYWDK